MPPSRRIHTPHAQTRHQGHPHPPLPEASRQAMFLVDSGGRVLDVNLKACKQFGFDRKNLVRRSLQALVVSKTLGNRLSNLKATNVHPHISIPCTLKSNRGKTFRAALNIRPVGSRHFRISVGAAKATRRPPAPVPSRIVDAFALLYSNSTSSVVVIDRDSNIVCANSRWLDNFSDPSRPASGSRLDDTWPHRTHCATSLMKVLAEVVRTRQAIHLDSRSVTFVHHPERGTTYWDWDIEPISGDKGEVEYLLFASTEVTDRKHLEEETKHNNMTLRAVLECSQVLLRNHDESEMISTVCRTMKETGGCQLVWFAAADLERRDALWPVAVSGTDAAMTSDWQHVWIASQEPEGPLTRAMANAATVRVRTSESEPADAGWRVEMQRRGLCSSLCLPVHRGNDLLGVLAVYTMSASRFEAEEARLLEELATDLALRMISLRSKLDTVVRA